MSDEIANVNDPACIDTLDVEKVQLHMETIFLLFHTVNTLYSSASHYDTLIDIP